MFPQEPIGYAQADDLSPHRWIRVEELVSSCGEGKNYVASFRFALRGVIPPQTGVSAIAEQEARVWLEAITFDSVIEALYPGQRLEFHLGTWRTGGASAGLDWNIVGRTCDNSPEAACAHAERLWETLALLLASQPDYRFNPMHDPLPEPDLRWSYRVEPRRAAVSALSGQMGFNAPSHENRSRVLHLPVLDDPGDNHFPVVLLLTSLPLDLELCIAIEPVSIDDSMRHALTSATAALAANNVSASLCRGDRGLSQADLRTQLSTWAEMLRHWAGQTEAVKTEITLHSAAPVSPGLIGTIGKALLPQFAFDSESAPEESAPSSASDVPALELHRWLPASHALLHGVFPDPAYLAGLDLPRSYPLPTARLPAEGLLLGNAEGQKIRLSQPDRSSHSYIVGATGSGKSTLLQNLILQDIEAGRGVCLIDPHGDLYQEVLARIPERRADEVVLFNPTDFDWAAGLNFLECTSSYPEIEQNLIVNEMLGIFERLYNMKEAGGPMFELYMRNALLLAMSGKQNSATILDIQAIFESRIYRAVLLARCQNPLVVSFWKNTAERADGEAALANIAPYITSKLNQFTHNTLMRRIVGQHHSTIRFREVMDRGGILLVNLAKGILSELDTRLLGLFIMGKLFHAALSRTDMAVEERRKFYVYVDEFQNFTTPTLGHILSEGRKFGLSMTLANQHLAQLKTADGHNLMGSVLGNVSNMFLFRLGVLDAESLEGFTKPWLRQIDLQYLPDYHVAARMLHDHQPIKPFVFKTESPIEKCGTGLAQSIAETSNSRYAQRSAQVDLNIQRRLEIIYRTTKPSPTETETETETETPRDLDTSG